MLDTILVALDVEDDSKELRNKRSSVSHVSLLDQVTQTLQQLQLRSTAKIVFSHVISTSQPVEVIVDRPHADLEDPHSRIERQLQAYQQNLPCESELEIVTGDPAEEIIRLANIYKADLIIIGNRGLTGMQRILLGSVSSQIVADAPCSVWVVKPK